MNRKIITYTLGKMLIIYAMILIVPLIIALGYWEVKSVGAFFITMILTLSLGLFLKRKKPKSKTFTTQEGVLTTALIWFTLILLGTLPFYLSGAIPSFTDAFFEATSGFTTTGSTILRDVEALPRAMLFWRGMTHFLGGIGVLVFAFAILSESGNEGYYLLKSEMTGSTFGKLVSRLKHTAIILCIIYCLMAVVLLILLLLGGLNWFDAIVHTFSTAGTGGFSSYNDSIAHFKSSYVHFVLSFGMLAFSINFGVYFSMWRNKGRGFLKSEEVRLFLTIVCFATIFMSAYLYKEGYDWFTAIKNGLFTTASIISTTGFGMEDFMLWPLIAQLVVLGLMFTGGCAGSTAGGFKISRLIVTVRVAGEYLQRAFSPRRMTTIRLDKKPLNANDRYEIGAYFILYVVSFWVIFAIICIDKYDFETTFAAVLTTFNNIGPGLGEIGASGIFADFSMLSKWVLSIGMVAGRLEIIPVLLFLNPASWRAK